ncbi:MAG TPA: hypothetical protein VE549_05020, partial [Myxococcaceae bacterium]|nr:hypothetical protein [Myxococcaceae bacterium]
MQGEVDGHRAVAELDPRFLSVAIDTAQVLGGEFWSRGGATKSIVGDARVPPLDLSRPELREGLRALAPVYLRIGGTAADQVRYELGSAPARPHSSDLALTLTARRWEEIVAFANAGDAPLIFTLAAGPGTRDWRGAWKPDQAAMLVEHATRRGDPVAVWELGNEPNAYPLVHGIGHSVSGRQLGRDLTAARAMLDRLGSPARLAAPASAFWPVIGELNPILARALRHGGLDVQIVTWHYYPQQSRRCPVAVRRASAERLLCPRNLDEFARWAAVVERARTRYAPRAELWLGETGNAQCGGEPGVSDGMAGTLWWIDQLGALARRGHRVVVRQTLIGSDYGLLDDRTLEPRPDYWASVLWKRVMG